MLVQRFRLNAEFAKELVFEKNYGTLVRHEWFADGYMLLAFSTGTIVTIGTHGADLEREVSSKNLFHGKSKGSEVILDLDVCHVNNKAAVVGESELRMLDVSGGKLKEQDESNIAYSSAIESVQFTADGQLLTFGSDNGDVVTMIAHLPYLNDFEGLTIGYITSLHEVTLFNMNNKLQTSITVEVEPSMLAVGQTTVAVGINNKAWFYKLDSEMNRAVKVNERDYLAPIDSLRCNDM